MTQFQVVLWVMVTLVALPFAVNIIFGGPEVRVGYGKKKQERVLTGVFRYWLGGESAVEHIPHILHVTLQLAVIVGAVYLCRVMKVPDYMALAAVAMVVWRGRSTL